MKNELIKFITSKNFPCVMAKAVAAKGMMSLNEVKDLNHPDEVKNLLEKFYAFIEDYRKYPDRLSSFIICLENKMAFEEFEKVFWNFLRQLNQLDKSTYNHDSRVASDPNSENFSFSLKEEAFFILALHPESPRFSRRFSRPTIVFNPHQQFENLRKAGIFKRVRDIIRKRDKILQGFINPMLKDFGEKSEMYQYTGRQYSDHDQLPSLT
jgi:FPC/CPF motif-containing protein YcgG